MKRLILVGFLILFMPTFAFSVEDFLYMPHWIKGKNFFDKHDYKNAILQYTSAIDILNNDQQALFLYNERAASYLKMGAYKESLKDSMFVFNATTSRKEALTALWNCLFCNLMIDEPNVEQKNLDLLTTFDEKFGINEKE